MLRRAGRALAPLRDPFKVLGLTRSATKAEVKMKYRELARIHHPDAEAGDSVKMEEINHAYKTLLKEGGYERLHLRGVGGAPSNATAAAADADFPDGRDGVGVTADSRHRHQRQAATAPFTVDQQRGASNRTSAEPPDPFASSPLTDDEVEKISALDPTTERRTPEGKYLYQSRDDQSWVELEKPLLRAQQPQYASFSHEADMNAELRRRAVLKEKEQNEKNIFQRAADRLADSADLPTRHANLLRLYVLLLLYVLYLMYKRTFERTHHQRKRTSFYQDLEERRSELMETYQQHEAGLQISVVAAALIFAAAAEHKTRQDAVVPSSSEVYFSTVKPPVDHFIIVAGG